MNMRTAAFCPLRRMGLLSESVPVLMGSARGRRKMPVADAVTANTAAQWVQETNGSHQQAWPLQQH